MGAFVGIIVGVSVGIAVEVGAMVGVGKGDVGTGESSSNAAPGPSDNATHAITKAPIAIFLNEYVIVPQFHPRSYRIGQASNGLTIARSIPDSPS